MPITLPSDTDKAQLWQAYHNRRPTRVPMRLNTNPRVVILDREWNPEGYTFEQAAKDPRIHLEVMLRHQLYVRRRLGPVTDGPTELPDVWDAGLVVYNVAEAAFLGAQVVYQPGQVPATEPFLDESNKHEIFQRDISDPLKEGFLHDCVALWHEMEKVCRDLKFEGRPVRLMPWVPQGTDGPLTIGCNLRGSAFLEDFMFDPQYADRVMNLAVDANIARRRALAAHWNVKSQTAPLADDSCEMLSAEMYRQRVLPIHRRFYESFEGDLPRTVHLCGDAERLFPILCKELGVTAIDTGFPLDHGRLRRAIGPDVEISGGPEVSVLMYGRPEQVHQRTREILQSGVMEGGRFVLEEGNNLPPCCPMENLRAMYEANLEFGGYQG